LLGRNAVMTENLKLDLSGPKFQEDQTRVVPQDNDNDNETPRFIMDECDGAIIRNCNTPTNVMLPDVNSNTESGNAPDAAMFIEVAAANSAPAAENHQATHLGSLNGDENDRDFDYILDSLLYNYE